MIVLYLFQNSYQRKIKKFQYKLVREGGNAKIFESSLQWLSDSGIISKNVQD